MRSITKRHTSTLGGKARFAQVTVAVLAPEEEVRRSELPELFLNDFRINRLTPKDAVLVERAVQAVRDTEAALGWTGAPLCVTRIESTYLDQEPNATGLAATAAATALINAS